jgi:hypothetical protein
MFEYMDNFEVHGEQWLREEQQLNTEALEVSKEIHLLMDDAAFTLNEIFKVGTKIRLGATDKQTRRQVGVLLNKLRINAEELVKVDKKHEQLKLKVLKFYHLPPDLLPNDHLQDHLITVEEVNMVMKQWMSMCKELDEGESWKDSDD